MEPRSRSSSPVQGGALSSSGGGGRLRKEEQKAPDRAKKGKGPEAKKGQSKDKQKEPTRGSKTKNAIKASERKELDERIAAKDAKREKLLESITKERDATVEALKKLTSPFDQITELLDRADGEINPLLEARPILGFSSAARVRAYVGDLKAANALDAAAGLKTLLLSYVGSGNSEDISRYKSVLPRTYFESLEVVTYARTNGAARRAFPAAVAGAILAVGSAVSKIRGEISPRSVLTVVRDKWVIGGVFASAVLYVLSQQRTPLVRPVYIKHEFEYEPLTPAEQASLSRDRRNMTFRAAQLLEASFGLRISHSAHLLYDSKDVSFLSTLSRSKISGPVVGYLKQTLYSVWVFPPPTVRDFHPVPEGDVIWNPECDRGFEVDGRPISPEMLRNRLLVTVPNVHGAVIDHTLFHWQAQNPAFMEFQRPFATKYNDIRQAFSVCGAIANDLRPEQYKSLYPATTILTMVQWLEIKTRSSGKTQPCQDWLF